MVQDSAKRQHLRVAVKVMVGFGIVAFVLMLLSSLTGGQGTSPAAPPMRISIDDISPGTAKYTLWNDRPIMVLYRDESALHALENATQTLVDPQSKRSDQPDSLDASLRSPSRQWFVAFSSGTDLSCPIEVREAGGEFQDQPWLGGLADTCRGSRYDFAGRVFAAQHASKNLAIPPYRINADGSITLGVSAQ